MNNVASAIARLYLAAAWTVTTEEEIREYYEEACTAALGKHVVNLDAKREMIEKIIDRSAKPSFCNGRMSITQRAKEADAQIRWALTKV